MAERKIIESWDDKSFKYLVTFHRLTKNTKENITTCPLRVFKYEDGDYVLDYDNHSMPHRSVEIKSITKL